jgi:predicted nucleic acid-binding protein
MRVIADTGFFVASINDKDQYHQWARRVAQDYKPPFYTCEAVIAEAAYLLNEKLGAKGIAVLMKMIANGSVRLDFSLVQHVERITTLVQRYENVPMDYADACLVVMAEQEKYREHVILTTDDTDFRIYRRNGRETLNIDTPQNRK